MSQIDILMATYNGAKYIKTQIYSIISQTFSDWRLLIHDDGSSDDTVEIIRELSRIDSRIVLIEDNIKCGGSAPNFMHLVQLATAQYAMFADQDDIWLDNKIQTMLDEIESKDNSIPQIVYSRLYVWLPNRGIGGKPMLFKASNLKQFLFFNSAVHGCVSMFNRATLELLQQWKGETMMHDCSLQLIGMTFGRITYMDTPLMLYRRHETTVTGDTITSRNEIGRLVRSNDIPVLFEGYYRMVEYFTSQYSTLISTDNKHTLNAFLQMRQKGLIGKLMSVLRNGFTLHGSTVRLLVKITLRPYTA